MKKHLKSILATTIILSGIGAGQLIALADTDTDTDTATTEGEIIFTIDAGESIPTHPDIPDTVDPGAPDGGDSGTDGHLRIDHVSDFRFGSHELNLQAGGTFNALPQRWINEETTTAPFIQVTDVRGTQEGWRLEVEQTGGQFRNTDGIVLNGAQLRLSSLRINNTVHDLPNSMIPLPEILPGNINLNPGGGAVAIATAGANVGMGTSHITFGTLTTIEGTPPVTTAPGVQLVIPPYAISGGTTDLNFTTELTWTLSNTP